jgi:LuxR family transcriptional regulator, maltose regulon positive regulatory protein
MLIARYWYGYMAAGQMVTVERWLESLSEELTSHDAALALVRAWMYALSGQREESERFLVLVESIPYKGPLPDGTASVEAGVAIVRASFGYDGVRSIVEAARRAAALEPGPTSPRAGLVRFALGAGLYLSGDPAGARNALEGALDLTREADQPLLRVVAQSFLSVVASEEGHLEEAESRAREAGALVDRFRLSTVPQATLAPIALGFVLAKRGELEEAETALEGALSVRRELPGLSPWPTLIGLLALASARLTRGDRGGGRAVLTEARTMLERYPDAGILPELLERQERKLRRRKPREGQLDGELTQRELDVLRLLGSEFSTRQMAQSLYVAPSTVRTQIKSIYRKLGVSSRDEAVEEAHARGLI